MPVRRQQLLAYPINTEGRDFAVGDIHGCFARLETALRQAGFSPEKDRLFSVGDLVDRGPQSHLVLEWLAQPWFHPVAGNHEQLTWQRALGDPVPGIDHREHGGRWLDQCAPDMRQRIAERLLALPLAIEVATPQGAVGIVHADFPYDDWQAARTRRFNADDEETCLWSIARYRTGYAQPVKNVRAVVHGHMTVRSMTRLGNVYYIDTGGWLDGGRFTLLDLHTLEAVR